jgi:hypothetical protein
MQKAWEFWPYENLAKIVEFTLENKFFSHSRAAKKVCIVEKTTLIFIVKN